MLRDNDAGKEHMDRVGHREGLDGEVVEILITPFEAEMLRVVIEAMRGCCEEKDLLFPPTEETGSTVAYRRTKGFVASGKRRRPEPDCGSGGAW